MQNSICPCSILSVSAQFILLFGIAQHSFAQVIPDTTLPQNSIVTGTSVTGGTRSGTTLFHSFRDFSVTGAILFRPEPEIQTIITRVTGNQRSLIDGLLAVNGNANFFLLNPNGITFGQKAQLAINGSFFASTAESLKFADGSEFRARNPQPPLLTISTPIGLQFGTGSGSIINQPGSRLLVPPGQTLALLGGNLAIAGGELIASSGKINLASVAGNEFFSLIEPNSVGPGNLQLSNNAQINTSGVGGGRVEIQGGQVSLDNIRVLAVTLGDQNGQGISIRANELRQNASQLVTATLGSGTGGNIELAAQSIEIRGQGVDLFRQAIAALLQERTLKLDSSIFALNTNTLGIGQAGQIRIQGDRVRFENGAVIASAAGGAGQGGNILLNARLIDINSSILVTGTVDESTGRGGNFEVQADRLILREGGLLSTGMFGAGNAGDILLNVKDSIELTKAPAGSVAQTSISSNSFGSNQARAGKITVETQRLTMSGGSGISSSSSGTVGKVVISLTGGEGADISVRASESIEISGISEVLASGTQIGSYLVTATTTMSPGGEIYIATPVLKIREGGAISSASLGFNQAGKITIDADRLELSGQTGEFISKIETSAGKVLFSSFENPFATADAGDLTLNVRDFTLRNNAFVSVENIGFGRAGSLRISANRITLDNRARINARPGAAGGGDLNLRSQLIALRRESNIQTDANRSNGGNIGINTGILLAIPSENSNITATAIEGRGGNIDITAKGILGLRQSRRDTSRSEINAAGSQPAFDGAVILKTFENEPALAPELPSTVMDRLTQIAPACSRVAKTHQFVITQRGGLEQSLNEVVQSTPIWVDERGRINPQSLQATVPTLEADRWIKQSDGTVVLIAGSSSQFRPIACLGEM